MLLGLVSSVVSSLVSSRLISDIRKYQYTSLTLLHRDRETRVPAYTNTNSADRPTLPTNIRTILSALGAR